MPKFCKKCGAQLNRKGKCPNCDAKQQNKKRFFNKRSIISIVVVVAVLLSSTAGYFAITFQSKAVTNDYTEDQTLANADQSGGTDGEQTAQFSSNVIVFAEDEAAEINSKISNVRMTSTGLYIDVQNGTSFDNLGSGDIFYLEGSQDTVLGETYIGKVSSAVKNDSVTTYTIETPMVDEVFDVLTIDFDKEFTADDISSVQTIPGVTVTQVDDISASFTQTANEVSQKPQVTPLTSSPTAAPEAMPVANYTSEGLVFDLKVDLLDVFGLTEEGAVGFDEYDYTEGGRINVCITETGKKYHKDTCPCLHTSQGTLTLVDAVNEGYEPCFICVPPILSGEKGHANFDGSLTLEGKVGLETLNYGINYDWDVLNGGGLQEFEAYANGNFIASVALKSQVNFEFGGQTTTFSIPVANVKLQGLKEKVFPIAFITYNGATFNAAFKPGNEYIRATTCAVPVTVAAIIYADIDGNITAEATCSFDFNYQFDCSYTAVRNGEWVNEWNCSNEPSFKTGLDVEVSADVDANVAASVSLYIFNLNVAELAVIKVGFEGEGSLKVSHTTEFRKVSGQWEKEAENEASFSAYARIYVKVLEINIKLKTRIKVWSFIDVSNTINYTNEFKDFTIAKWGTPNPTRFDSSLMSFSHVTAKDQQAIYYKDINDVLIKEEDSYKTVLYDQSFFSICGIDASYIYLLIPNEQKYEVRRVAKNGSSSKIILDDVANLLEIDEKYIYYISTFDNTCIMRLDREKLKEDQFADFDEEVVKFMGLQSNGFYVVTEDNDFFSAFFGGGLNYYLLNSSGKIAESYGDSPDVSQYYLSETDLYYEAAKMSSSGYLRNTASEIYWMSHDRSATVLAEGISGWNSKDVGIFTTLKKDDGTNQIVLYRAEDGARVSVTDVNSDQAFFTLCKSSDGKWYFFDQTDSDLILYVMTSDFSTKTEVKRFSLSEIPYNLNDCSMTIMNNRIFFYTMPNDTTSKVLYRYDIFGGGFR